MKAKNIEVRGKIIRKYHLADEVSTENPPPEFHILEISLEMPVDGVARITLRVNSEMFEKYWSGSSVSLSYQKISPLIEKNFTL